MCIMKRKKTVEKRFITRRIALSMPQKKRAKKKKTNISYSPVTMFDRPLGILRVNPLTSAEVVKLSQTNNDSEDLGEILNFTLELT